MPQVDCDSIRGVELSHVQKRFGERLRSVRTNAGFSQERLAEIAGLHRTYISSVERGERNVTIETVEKLAHALNVTLADLMP
ncbi:MAG: helix-turn-helix domain-containing protein [Planctomycetota bacterium]|nr:helix-turn-helix domain-containing protein [Planctomycetota bacterium]